MKTTPSEALIQDMEHFLKSRHSEQTAGTYLFYIRHFCRANPQAVEFTYKEVVHYMAEERKRHQKAHGKPTGSMNAKLSAIKRFYDYLIETGYRKDHPCKGLTMRGTRTKGINFAGLFTPEELHGMIEAREERFGAWVELRNKALISILVFQGPTSQELCSIKLSHLDFDKGQIYFPAGSKTASRSMTMQPVQAMLLYRYIHESRPKLLKGKDSSILFIGMRGEAETVDGLHSMLEPMKSLFPGKILNPKTIRMSVIANWLNVKGYPIEEAQMLAGHRWPSSTLVYKRSDDDQAKETIDKFHPLM